MIIKMDKKEIVSVLNEISTLYELRGENFFKIRAYHAAARALEVSDINLNADTKEDELTAIKGIGKSIASQIVKLLGNERLDLYENLKSSVPAGLIEMLKIPKLGPRKIKYLYDEMGVSDIGQLEAACIENRIAVLPNFGKKTQENILHGIELVKKFSEAFLYSAAIEQAEIIVDQLKSSKHITHISIAGSLRRKKGVVKDIDIVACSQKPGEAMDLFTGLAQVREIIAKGDTKSSIRLKSAINADLRIVKNFQYPYALHHFTGSKEHNTAMRSLAKKSGIKMNEYGIFKNDKLIKCRDEKEIFSVFNMGYIEPELRENTGEIEAASLHKLPDLINEKDIMGLFHFHTDKSDGNMSLRQAVSRLIKMGFSYCGVSDHSKTAAYAGGIADEKIGGYIESIDSVKNEFKEFTVFSGIESDILADGSLDYSDEILSFFDFVIIAVHSNFNMNRKAMTERIIKGMQNRYATMLAHPTGRLLLARDPYDVDISAIIDAASHYNVDMEINASPFRLDLDWQNCKYAKEKNVKIFINPDAHSLEGFKDYKYGVNVARKGWLEKTDVVNTWPADKVALYLSRKKNS